jgi:hypothetical protein
MAYRCAAASLQRDEDLLGTASRVRAFLLVENAGPWGTEALLDVRLPDDVKRGLQTRSRAADVRTLLVRRHRNGGDEGGTRVFAAYADPVSPWLETTTLAGPEQLLDLDIEALGRGRSPGLERSDQPVFGVCTHGRHDACCAELGRPVAAALSDSHPEETWEISHVGGDRFAANVLVLPDGLYYGRVSAADAPRLGARHRDGHLVLDLLRGRSGLPFVVQVAEVAARREAGETRINAVRVVSLAGSADETSVALDVGGTPYDVRVRRTTRDEPHRLTCRAEREQSAPAYEVVSVVRASLGAASSGPASPPSPRG